MKTRYAISRARRTGQRGNAMLEFAVSAVVLLLLTVGVVDFSRVFTAADTATSAASAGAQYGALSPAHWSDFSGIQEAALDEAGNGTGVTAAASNTCYCAPGSPAVPCPADCSQGGGAAMTYITVSVSVPFSPMFTYAWMPALTSLSSTNSVRVQ